MLYNEYIIIIKNQCDRCVVSAIDEKTEILIIDLSAYSSHTGSICHR